MHVKTMLVTGAAVTVAAIASLGGAPRQAVAPQATQAGTLVVYKSPT